LPLQHHHWIDGRPYDATSSDGFDVRIEGTRSNVGRWPRAGAPELDAALAACARDERTWSTLPARERRRRLERALDQWLVDRAREEETIAALGCTPRELDLLMQRAARDVEKLFEDDSGSVSALDPSAGGANVVLLEWTEAFSRTAQLTFAGLLAGRSVVLVSDARTPMIADGLAAALACCANAPTATLHDDGRTVVRAAFEHDGVSRVHVASTSAASAEMSARTEPARTLVIERGFGAGVEIAREKKLHGRSLSNRSFVVRADRDLGEQALDVVALAFGRLDALSGFAPGRVGRALVPTRCFSRFTAEILEALADDPDTGDPLAIARSLGVAQIERAFALGHDEGATAIFTGIEAADLSFPLVFTNVEERMKLARSQRPAPFLCLMRVADETRARELASRIDV